MKPLLLTLFTACCLGAMPLSSMGQQAEKKNTTMQSSSHEKLLRHVVSFKFKDSATPAQIKEVEDAFAALPSKINTIVGLEWGLNNSPENLAQGYTHCFLVTFKDEAGRDFYLPHPAHKAFGALLKPYLDKVFVIDFFGK